jgi:hypothetical protein
LLAYLKAARNAHEHGEPTIVNVKARANRFPLPPDAPRPFFSATISAADGTEQTISSATSEVEVLVMGPLWLELIPIKGTRNSSSQPPPQSHLGRQITDQTPVAIGALALDHLEKTLVQVRAFIA